MTKIAFVGTSADEQALFTERLQGHALQFVRDEDWQQLDPETEILSVFVDFQVNEEVLNFLSNVKLVTCRSTGYNNVDASIARQRGIIVANTPGYGATSVAEYVFGLILALSRKITVVEEKIKDSTIHEGIDRAAERGWDIGGRTIGIVGLGAIGKGVARIARGFGMRILAFEPYKRDVEFATAYSVEFIDDLTQICRDSDIVTLHAPYTPGNHHMVNAEMLAQMKPTALLINTSRGELVNTLQVARLLKDGKLGGAGLDVIEDESFLTDPNAVLELATSGNEKAVDKLKHALAMLTLQRLPNAIITNHNAYNTVEAMQKINDMTLENIVNYIEGAPEGVHSVSLR